MSGNEVKEEDLEKLKDLDTTLSDINNLIGKQLNLSTKIGGIRGEILTLLKLREKYGNRDIRWYGGLVAFLSGYLYRRELYLSL